MLVGRLRRSGDGTELLDAAQLGQVLPATTNADADLSIAISLLESLSTSALALSWPADLLEHFATMLPTLSENPDVPVHTTFLALRLTLNLTNATAWNCELFARAATVQYLLSTVETGFDALDTAADEISEQQRSLSYDLLVLAMGCTINLAEHSETARLHTINNPVTMQALLDVFVQAQQRMEDAESLSEGTNNVAFGYLAVMLANICQSAEARTYVASKLPGGKLDMLVEAVAEFVRHHEKVDTLSFTGEEGMAVWGAFTEKLRAVLQRISAVAGEV